MQKAVGIICEYNPLHRGHVAQLDAVRARFGDKPIVLVMSGNYVQRAEAAVCDQYARARAAVEAGADLVLLLPFPYSTFGAHGYAESALSVLWRTGVVDTLAFGAECADETLLKTCADTLCSASFEARLQEKLTADVRAAYAHLRAETLSELVPGAENLLKTPNNILALEYLSVIQTKGYDLTPAIFHRPARPSATAIRTALEQQEDDWGGDVPSEKLRRILQEGPLPQKKLEETLLLALRAGLNCPELAFLGARVAESVRRASDFSDFLLRAKTRKVPVARVRRGVLHAYFAVEEEGMPEVPYTVLLAANEIGRAVLSFIYNKGEIPVFTKPSAPLKGRDQLASVAELAARADSVYAGLCGREGGWFLKQGPEIMNKL